MIRYLLHKLGIDFDTWIWLEGFDGKTYDTYIRISPFGTRTAYVFPAWKVGIVVLLDDGTVGQPHYINRWKTMKPEHHA